MMRSIDTQSPLSRIVVTNADGDALSRFRQQAAGGRGYASGQMLRSQTIKQELRVADLALLVDTLSRELDQFGFAIANLVGAFADHGGTDATAGIATLLSFVGRPIKVFRNQPDYWRTIDVDVHRPPDRSRGTGAQGLHMDFVNAEFPPDLVCLYCVRPDPLGGGASTLARIDSVTASLSSGELDVLSRPIYVDGVVKDLDSVGTDANPFRVFSPGANFEFRYTANLLKNPPDSSAAITLAELDARLRKNIQADVLEAGDLLIIDQHRTVHGRRALGEGQAALAPANQRLVLQCFLRR